MDIEDEKKKGWCTPCKCVCCTIIWLILIAAIIIGILVGVYYPRNIPDPKITNTSISGFNITNNPPNFGVNYNASLFISNKNNGDIKIKLLNMTVKQSSTGIKVGTLIQRNINFPSNKNTTASLLGSLSSTDQTIVNRLFQEFNTTGSILFELSGFATVEYLIISRNVNLNFNIKAP
eukprot:TRINITY_DN2862_c0_g2_i1.p1 TRINITY_DN2862_c0_g2~~TRINITY_DN2862_c0_g2_i1.p1  ORF type:complete len:184 (-),score=52.22 TRINITY_DN2862_c0_g2_i1:99-629(-)